MIFKNLLAYATGPKARSKACVVELPLFQSPLP
jgi:hypothetical protein